MSNTETNNYSAEVSNSNLHIHRVPNKAAYEELINELDSEIVNSSLFFIDEVEENEKNYATEGFVEEKIEEATKSLASKSYVNEEVSRKAETLEFPISSKAHDGKEESSIEGKTIFTFVYEVNGLKITDYPFITLNTSQLNSVEDILRLQKVFANIFAAEVYMDDRITIYSYADLSEESDFSFIIKVVR